MTYISCGVIMSIMSRVDSDLYDHMSHVCSDVDNLCGGNIYVVCGVMQISRKNDIDVISGG